MRQTSLEAPDDSDRFTIALALRLHVLLGPMEVLGESNGGFRQNYPIIGGTFTGEGLRGTVIGSGADLAMLRGDGVYEIDALYRIRTDDGVVIIVHNQGLYQEPEDSAVGRAYFRTTPRFTAPKGRYAWLNESIFIGTVDDFAENEIIVSCYALGGD